MELGIVASGDADSNGKNALPAKIAHKARWKYIQIEGESDRDEVVGRRETFSNWKWQKEIWIETWAKAAGIV